MTSTEVHIREIQTDDSLDELTNLLHKAYEIRLEQGFRFTATYQDVETTRSRISEGQCYLAFFDGVLIGTATIRPPNPEDEVELYRTAWGFGQFGVLPNFRGKGIGHKLYLTCEQYALSKGATSIGLDTPETAFELIEMYRAWGFSAVAKFDYLHTNYVSVVMQKRL